MGGKSGGGSGTQNVQQTTFSLPEEFYPYVHETLDLARGEAYRPYEAYVGPRIAPFSDDRLSAFEQTRNLGSVGQDQFDAGDTLTGIAAAGAANSGYNPNAVGGGYQATNYDPTVAQWDNTAAQQYMNPYLTQVMDAMTARANNQYNQGRIARDARAAQSGLFGGYRQGVEEGVAYGQNQLGLNSAIADTLMRGYDTAYGQFNQDRSARENSRQFAANLNDSSSRAATDYAFQDEANRLRGAQQNLAMSQGLAGIGQQMYGQGVTRRDEELRGIGALNDAALSQERLTQASLDQAYNDFVNQRDYNRNNITWLNNIIRGNVTGANSNVVNTQEVNPYTQMLGLGIGAAGLFNAMNGSNSGNG